MSESTPRRRAGWAAAAALMMIAFGSACSTTVPVPSIPSITVNSDPAAVAKVEAYCKKVDELVAKANDLQASPNPSLSAELGEQAQKLAEQAVGLVGAVAANPALAARVSECSAKTAGLVGG